MSVTTTNPAVGTAAAQPFQAVVAEIHDDGLVVVRPLASQSDTLLCELVLGPDGAPWLTPGIRVLVAPAPSDLEYSTIVGRIGRATEAKPREIELEAGEQITLKCGKGSVTLRSDGKVVLRGVEILTTAQRRNRVKGGTVEIN